MPRLRTLALSLAAASAVASAGCGENAPAGETAAVTVTRGFGQEAVVPTRRAPVGPGATAMRQLQRVARTKLTFGGKYVHAIEGISEDAAAGASWLYYVDGIELDVGAASWRLKPGEQVQWDYHPWFSTRTGGAIVGAYPRPLLTRRAFVKCVPDGVEQCDAVRARLTAAGVQLRGRADDTAVTVAVGEWADLARAGELLQIGDDPAMNGVFAAASGDRLRIASADGAAPRALPSGAGLVAAKRVGEELRWYVTGVGRGSLANAVGLLRPEILRNRFAVASTPDGRPVALPVPEASR